MFNYVRKYRERRKRKKKMFEALERGTSNILVIGHPSKEDWTTITAEEFRCHLLDLEVEENVTFYFCDEEDDLRTVIEFVKEKKRPGMAFFPFINKRRPCPFTTDMAILAMNMEMEYGIPAVMVDVLDDLDQQIQALMAKISRREEGVAP